MSRYVFALILGALSAPAAAMDVLPFTAAQLERVGIELRPVEAAEGVSSDRMPAQVVIPPEHERVITSPQAGLVVGLQSAVGNTVRQGEELAHLESPELIGLQRALLHGITQMELARADLERDRRLHDEGIIAQRRYLETRSRFEEASATLDEHRQALRLAGMSRAAVDQIEKTRQLSSRLAVASPIDGVVLQQLAAAGQRVEMADPLYRVGRLDALWLEIRVPLDSLALVRAGLEVEVVGCPEAAARTTMVGGHLDPENQTALVRAELSPGAECLHPGQFIEVRFTMGTGGDLHSVPTSAVVRSGEANLVFVRRLDGFEARPVQVIGQRGEQSIVRGALAKDEHVASHGLAALKGAWLGIGGGE